MLLVARAHGTAIAAVWSGRSREQVVRLRRDVDGYSRGRGHPSKAEMDAMAPRRRCRCGRCAEHWAAREAAARRRLVAVHEKALALRVEADPDDWRSRALCAGLDPNLWFPTRGESTGAVREICRACPVADDCLDFALATGEKFGIWGGRSERERRRMRRVRRAGGVPARERGHLPTPSRSWPGRSLMAWVKLDDRWRDHEKILRAVHMAGTPLVRWLWVEGLSECNDNKTDGVLAVYRLAPVAEAAGVPRGKRRDACVAALVASGLWHDDETIADCRRCIDALVSCGRELNPGDVYFHDYCDYQPARADIASPEERKRTNRRNALKRDDALREVIYERDHGLCRYCGIVVDTNENNRRGHNRLTHDHVDPGCFEPNGGNTPETVVLACGRCNARKGDRTPEQAGMPLLPPGTTALDLATGEIHRIDPTPGPGTDPTGRARVEIGSGRVGIGSVPGRSGSGRSGSGRAPSAPTPRARKQKTGGRVSKPP